MELLRSVLLIMAVIFCAQCGMHAGERMEDDTDHRGVKGPKMSSNQTHGAPVNGTKLNNGKMGNSTHGIAIAKRPADGSNGTAIMPDAHGANKTVTKHRKHKKHPKHNAVKKTPVNEEHRRVERQCGCSA